MALQFGTLRRFGHPRVAFGAFTIAFRKSRDEFARNELTLVRRPVVENLPAEKRGLAPGLPGACPPFSARSAPGFQPHYRINRENLPQIRRHRHLLPVFAIDALPDCRKRSLKSRTEWSFLNSYPVQLNGVCGNLRIVGFVANREVRDVLGRNCLTREMRPLHCLQVKDPLVVARSQRFYGFLLVSVRKFLA